MNKTEEAVRKFLSKYIKNQDIDSDQNIFKSGLVNSLFAMQLVLYIEDEFSLPISNQDMRMENFSTIQAITYFINTKLNL